MTPEQIERAEKSKETARHAFYAGWLMRKTLFDRDLAFDHWWREVMEIAANNRREDLVKEYESMMKEKRP